MEKIGYQVIRWSTAVDGFEAKSLETPLKDRFTERTRTPSSRRSDRNSATNADELLLPPLSPSERTKQWVMNPDNVVDVSGDEVEVRPFSDRRENSGREGASAEEKPSMSRSASRQQSKPTSRQQSRGSLDDTRQIPHKEDEEVEGNRTPEERLCSTNKGEETRPPTSKDGDGLSQEMDRCPSEEVEQEKEASSEKGNTAPQSTANEAEEEIQLKSASDGQNGGKHHSRRSSFRSRDGQSEAGAVNTSERQKKDGSDDPEGQTIEKRGKETEKVVSEKESKKSSKQFANRTDDAEDEKKMDKGRNSGSRGPAVPRVAAVTKAPNLRGGSVDPLDEVPFWRSQSFCSSSEFLELAFPPAYVRGLDIVTHPFECPRAVEIFVGYAIDQQVYPISALPTSDYSCRTDDVFFAGGRQQEDRDEKSEIRCESNDDSFAISGTSPAQREYQTSHISLFGHYMPPPTAAISITTPPATGQPRVLGKVVRRDRRRDNIWREKEKVGGYGRTKYSDEVDHLLHSLIGIDLRIPSKTKRKDSKRGKIELERGKDPSVVPEEETKRKSPKDPIIGRIEAKKRAAIENEKYDKAKRLKSLCELYQTTLQDIKEAEEAKAIAVDDENFEAAAQCKQSIIASKKRIEAIIEAIDDPTIEIKTKEYEEREREEEKERQKKEKEREQEKRRAMEREQAEREREEIDEKLGVLQGVGTSITAALPREMSKAAVEPKPRPKEISVDVPPLALSFPPISANETNTPKGLTVTSRSTRRAGEDVAQRALAFLGYDDLSGKLFDDGIRDSAVAFQEIGEREKSKSGDASGTSLKRLHYLCEVCLYGFLSPSPLVFFGALIAWDLALATHLSLWQAMDVASDAVMRSGPYPKEVNLSRKDRFLSARQRVSLSMQPSGSRGSKSLPALVTSLLPAGSGLLRRVGDNNAKVRASAAAALTDVCFAIAEESLGDSQNDGFLDAPGGGSNTVRKVKQREKNIAEESAPAAVFLRFLEKEGDALPSKRQDARTASSRKSTGAGGWRSVVGKAFVTLQLMEAQAEMAMAAQEEGESRTAADFLSSDGAILLKRVFREAVDRPEEQARRAAAELATAAFLLFGDEIVPGLLEGLPRATTDAVMETLEAEIAEMTQQESEPPLGLGRWIIRGDFDLPNPWLDGGLVEAAVPSAE